MPEIRNYKVTQVREVDVEAYNAVEASLIAEAAFDNGQDERNLVKREGPWPELLRPTWGNTTSKVREISLRADEKGK